MAFANDILLGGLCKNHNGIVTNLVLLMFIGTLARAARVSDAETRPPNVVLLIMDDVGMGDIGCFGNDTIKTPNIDGLATEGAKLTQHMSLAMCTPSRAALLTGRLPARYSSWLRLPLILSARDGLPSEEFTVAEILKGAGYATALIGKWHLGIACTDENSCSDPRSQGFDYFYGLPLGNLRDCGTKNTIFQGWAKPRRLYTKINYSVISALAAAVLLKWVNVIGRKGFVFFLFVALACVTYMYIGMNLKLGCVLMENREIVELPLRFDYLTERLHSRAIQFIETHRDQPFLLVMSLVQAHTALFNNDQFRGHSVHGQYGDNLEEMDWSVGEVLTSLKKLNLENNTFVYLTSDNGGHVEEFTDDGEREGGWNGIYKGSKGTTWEGGIRVPAIVKLPGVVPPGTVIAQPTHLPDVLPTVARVTGVKLPDDRVYDGRDLIPLLTNTGSSEILHEFMFHYCRDTLNAVRYTPNGGPTFKLHYATTRLVTGIYGVEGCFDTYLCECSGQHVDIHDPPLVYDLTKDPSETQPLDSANPKVLEIVRKVNEAVSKHRATIPHKAHPTGLSAQVDVFLPKPWARPWCGSFPLFTCVDPYLDQLKTMKKTFKKN